MMEQNDKKMMKAEMRQSFLLVFNEIDGLKEVFDDIPIQDFDVGCGGWWLN